MKKIAYVILFVGSMPRVAPMIKERSNEKLDLSFSQGLTPNKIKELHTEKSPRVMSPQERMIVRRKHIFTRDEFFDYRFRKTFDIDTELLLLTRGEFDDLFREKCDQDLSDELREELDTLKEYFYAYLDSLPSDDNVDE